VKDAAMAVPDSGWNDRHARPNFTRLNGGFSSLLEHLQSADHGADTADVNRRKRVAENTAEVAGGLGNVEDN
jgi:hypothetical protein